MLKVNKKSLIYGTVVLTMANIFVRLLGFVYRIFLSRTVGPQGIGLSQLAFPVFIIAISITSSGLAMAVSRLVAEKKAQGDTRAIFRIVKMSSFMVCIISVIISLFIFKHMDYIATNVLHDARVRISLLVMLPCILISSLGSVLKGYFYGLKNIHPSALDEVIEQITRMLLVFLLIIYVPNKTDEITAAIIILGMVIGELSSLVYLSYSYKKHKLDIQWTDRGEGYFTIFQQIYHIAVPVTCTRIFMSVMSSVNSVLIPRQLMASGLTNHEAVGMYGIITGMVMPLLFLPFTIISSLSVMIIPTISEKMTVRNYSDVKNKISTSIQLSCITAFFSSGVLIAFGHPIGIVLYNQPLVGIFLIPLAGILIFQCLQHNLASILNGLGKQNIAAFHFIIGGMIQLGFTYFLVCRPEWRIKGYVLGYILSTVIVCLLNFIQVAKTIRIEFKWGKWFIQPALISLFVALSMRLFYALLISNHIRPIFSLIICVFSGFMTELILLMMTDISKIHIFKTSPRNKKYKISGVYNMLKSL